MDLQLKDKVALVTGGSHGLGESICLELAAEGARVAVNYRRDPEKAAAVVGQIRSTCGVEASAVLGDVSREADVVAMFDRIEEELGPVDVLVNNAAVCPTCLVKDMTEQVWNHTLQVNLTGTFLTSREIVRRLLAAGRKGRIVKVSLTVSLAREVAADGIAVNAVAPGMMYTEMTAKTLDANREKYLARIPLRRIGDPAEIAAVVVFLASDRASYMTGETVDVSGGLLMR